MSDISVEYAIGHGGVDTGRRLHPVGDSPGSVSVTSDAEIKLALTATVSTPEKLDPINDRLRVHLTVDGVRYPLGLYVIAQMPRSRTQTFESVEITAYGICYLLTCGTLGERRYYPAGTKYTDIFGALLLEAGIADFSVTPSAATLTEDREFEPGETLLSVLNTLLGEVNYNSVWETMNGVVMCTPAVVMNEAAVGIVYEANRYSLLYPDAAVNSDTFDRYNRFVGMVENSDPAKCLVSVSVNDSPGSLISTVSQGRAVTKVISYDHVADQATLDALVNAEKLKSMMRTEETTWYTGPNPVHTCWDFVQLKNGYEDGAYAEIFWSIELGGTCKMEHRGKRTVIV